MFLKVIGAKANIPVRSKRVRKYSQARLVSGPTSLTIDAGNRIIQKSDLYLITHLHNDHIEKFHTIPAGSNVWVPSSTFIRRLLRKNPNVRIRVIKPGQTHKFRKFLITPFEVSHSKTTKTFMFRIKSGNVKLAWVTDFRNLLGKTDYLKNLDYLFLGASTLSKDVTHKDHGSYGHMALTNSLEFLKMRNIKPKVIYPIHFGRGLFPLNVKIPYVAGFFPEYEIKPIWDGKLIRLS